MANAIVTFKLMPTSPDVDCDSIVEKAKAIATETGAKGNVAHEVKPIAFGLKEIIIIGMYEMSEDFASDSVADKMSEIEGVSNAEVQNVDLAMG
jgi:translation elongation factor aEF-1 beta